MEIVSKELEKFEVEKKLKEILFIKNFTPGSLEWGMNYITFSPSKRVRPLLLLESYKVFSSPKKKPGHDTYLLGAIIELLHTYSLVHDDLPCMDNDELRRGVKTLHVIKNEAFAVLVGDALLTRAFSLLSDYSKPHNLPRLISYLTGYSGHNGMLKGQLLDMEAENKKLSLDDIHKINYYKTGNLITLALLAGAIDSGAAEEHFTMLEKLGTLIGYIFQLQDDILDIVGHTHIIGKQVGSDLERRKASLPLSQGVERARELLENFKTEALLLIRQLPGNRSFFKEFITFLTTREK